MKHVDRVLNYLILIFVAVVAIMWGVFDAWIPKQADLPRVLGFILGLLVAMTVHTWSRYDRVSATLERVTRDLERLSTTSTRLAEGVDRQFTQMSFADALGHAFKVCPEVRELKIYALSTELIQIYLFAQPFRIALCTIQLWQPPADERWSYLSTRIDAIIKQWKDGRQNRGSIDSVEIRRFSQRPTEYLMIFDDTAVIWGAYHPEPADSTGTKSSDPFFISGNNAANRLFIAELTKRFEAEIAQSPAD
jgi:hypothetical protein